MENDKLSVRLTKYHEGSCNFCSHYYGVVAFTSTRVEGGLLVRMCGDCLKELNEKGKKL